MRKVLCVRKIMSAPIGNPLCIWYALELKRYSDIDEQDAAASCERKNALCIKACVPAQVHGAFEPQLVCTTEDQTDALHYNRLLEPQNGATRTIKAIRCKEPGK